MNPNTILDKITSKTNYTEQDILNLVKILTTIPDLVSLIVTDLQDAFKQAGFKYDYTAINRVSKLANDYVRNADRTWLKDKNLAQEQYGNLSEGILDIILSKITELENNK